MLSNDGVMPIGVALLLWIEVSILRVKVISGFPASGKTTYVANHVGANDLVYDYDALMAAITGQPFWSLTHDRSEYIEDILYHVLIARGRRDPAIGTLWIIRTVPSPQFRCTLAGLDVTYYYMNATVGECLQRINSQAGRENANTDYFGLLMELKSRGEQGAFEGYIFINQGGESDGTTED